MFNRFFSKFYDPKIKGQYKPQETTLPDVVGDSDYVVSKYAQDQLDSFLSEFKFTILDRAAKITTQYSERFEKPKVDSEAINHILQEYNLDEELKV